MRWEDLVVPLFGSSHKRDLRGLGLCYPALDALDHSNFQGESRNSSSSALASFRSAVLKTSRTEPNRAVVPPQMSQLIAPDVIFRSIQLRMRFCLRNDVGLVRNSQRMSNDGFCDSSERTAG